jgi:hypothetical protein
MLAKQVGCWRYGYWQQITLFYEPIPKGGIPPEQHPAVLEDLAMFDDEPLNRKLSWKKGEMALRIVRYLRLNGPSLVSEITEDLEGNAPSITRILKTNPQLFRPMPIKRLMPGAGRATIWTVNQEAYN